MLHFVFWAIILMVFAAAAVAAVFALFTFLAFACAVGIPLYILARLAKPRLQHFGSLQSSVAGNSQAALERLKALYVEGKIDLFEFERRAAHLISAE
jgi:hypothetical protein